jgi:hypothetical protein
MKLLRDSVGYVMEFIQHCTEGATQKECSAAREKMKIQKSVVSNERVSLEHHHKVEKS